MAAAQAVDYDVVDHAKHPGQIQHSTAATKAYAASYVTAFGNVPDFRWQQRWPRWKNLKQEK